jgi:Domain of unknown function (DUF309)
VTVRLTVVDADGRKKAYRPLSATRRAAALAEGIAAYERGDFFDAHELLEPAWMGTDDRAERSLFQGLIKLAAAYVHATRGNPAGIVKNLEGSRMRLREALAAGSAGAGLDVARLLDDIDVRLLDLAAHPDGPTLGPPDLRRSVS